MDDDFDLDLDDMLDGLGASNIPSNETPEQKFYRELTAEGKYKKIENVRFWLKHELYISHDLEQQGYIVYKPHKDGKIKVSRAELARKYLQYYFYMMFLPRFEIERPEMQHKAVKMEPFLDLVVGHPSIKEIIENPVKMS